jgi:transcriptional regulator with XRE-family HTH domain
MAMTPPSLGARIRRARERAQLSQEELARAVGASPRAVGDWENDRRRPRNRLGALEEVLGVRLDDDPDPDLPTPAEMDRLRDHIREVLGDKADTAIDAIDRAVAKDARARRSGAGGTAGPARRQAS